MNRPFFSAAVEELEAQFQKHERDVRALKELDHELSFRSVPKAHELRSRVRRALAALGQDASGSTEAAAAGIRDDEAPIELHGASPPRAERGAVPQRAPAGPPHETAHATVPAVELVTERAASNPPDPTADVDDGPVRSSPGTMPTSIEEAHLVLNVARGTAWEQIESARQQKVDLAHPERISSLDRESRDRIVLEAKRANAAYLLIARSRGVAAQAKPRA